MNSINHNKPAGTNCNIRGFALLMVLMLIVTAAVVGISYIYGAQVKTASTGNLMLATQARYLAESGLQHGIYALQTGEIGFGSSASPNGRYHIESGDGGYVFYITSTSTPNDYQIIATGTESEISQTVSLTARLSSIYAQKMIETVPTHWWRLGDTGLTALDQLGTHNGLYVNGVTRSVEGALAGDVDTAAEFSGSNSHVNLGTLETLSGSQLTFGCWARADAWASDNPRLISRASGPEWFDRRLEISVASTRKLRFTLRLADTVYELYGQTQLQLGQWYFVACVYNRGTQKINIYLNGEKDAMRENVLDADINDSDLIETWIGDCPTTAGQQPWKGAIDEVFIIKGKALGPALVKELYETRTPNIKTVSWDD